MSQKGGFTANEVKAGITVLAAGAVLFLFIAVIYGLRPSRPEKTFRSDFLDTGGLNLAGDVRFGGLKVGRVAGIAPSPSDRARIRVTWTVGAEIPVNAKCVASISQVSIATDKHLEVSTGEREAPLLPEGAEVPVRDGGGGMFSALDGIAADVHRVLSDEGALGDLRKILGVKRAGGSVEEPRVPLTDLLAHADRTVTDGSALLADLRAAVNDGRKDLREVLRKLEEMEDSAGGLMERLDGVVDENREDVRGSIAGVRDLVERAGGLVEALSGDLEKVIGALDRLLAEAGGLTGEARGMVAENRPVLEETLRELREAVRNLKRFAQIAADKPNALLLGAPPEGRQ